MKRTWWKESVVYQIYPISFKDSNGDGVGDLRGILSKLDYLQDLGVDVVWICPIYQSPGHDNGYDISDYYKIDPAFGTMEDFDELLEGLHARGMKLMMDLVLNHTSDEHPWFLESRKSKDNPKRDYYIWRKGKNGGPPNNWESYFSGSVWEYDERTDEYYLHLYSKHQPDLNWENPAVIRELHDMVKWWLQKGVDGFRFDAIAHIAKAKGLPDADNPQQTPTVRAYELFSNLDDVHTLLQDLYDNVLYYYDIMTVGETSGLGPEEALCYVGDDRRELNMTFQFEHMFLDAASAGSGKWDVVPWKLTDLKEVISRWQTVLHGRGWNANYLCNHDQPRAVSRFGNDQEPYRIPSAKMLATFLHMLEGTPYIYQGEEIGMTNVVFDSIDDYRDVETLNYYEEQRRNGVPEADIMRAIHLKSRDNARTPMQWDAGPQAGFTTAESAWIRVNPNHERINVEEAIRNPDSIYHYYKELIRLRKEHAVIVYGAYELLLPDHPQIYAFTRKLEKSRLLVILNFSSEEPVFEWPVEAMEPEDIELLISNYAPQEHEDLLNLPLRPYEARVYLKRY
ncbi:glycoside hydrolase family 13 protein [Paenibacillus barengoltzii]|jgi:oligo-1,6-glucosidase|uniref:oligo-1,6-glucosidase n=1 Tax=Paenibacillus barengoltzii J12 TaxID=935846 RepID=A0ABY1LXM4_9BACL|nr:alpha-glucosidase [Paenibacillus barengoltzii]MEC2344781.1 alpha-glucosidase [Paenibacillus barengoltzii]SMF27569.1 oligo-1,6-glucosidase [Paenibacillus barengoltzii J12]